MRGNLVWNICTFVPSKGGLAKEVVFHKGGLSKEVLLYTEESPIVQNLLTPLTNTHVCLPFK